MTNKLHTRAVQGSLGLNIYPVESWKADKGTRELALLTHLALTRHKWLNLLLTTKQLCACVGRGTGLEEG